MGPRYQELVASGLQPSQVSFNILLKACMRCKDAARADEVLTWMAERGWQVRACADPKRTQLE